MADNPYFQMPSNIPVDENMKRAAITNALLQFGASMVQPQQGRNSLQKFLNAIPGSLQQGMGGYNQSLLGTTQARTAYDTSATDLDYKKRHAALFDIQTKEKEYEMQGKKAEQEWENSLPNILVSSTGNAPEIGAVDVYLPEWAAQNSNIPATAYRRSPRLLRKFLEDNAGKLQGITIKHPKYGEVSLDDAVKIQKLEATPDQKDVTYSKLEGEIFRRWLDGEQLTPNQKQILNKKLKESGDTPQDAYSKTVSRYKAKLDFYEKSTGQKASNAEKRAMIINDPWGFLADEGGSPQASPGGRKPLSAFEK